MTTQRDTKKNLGKAADLLHIPEEKKRSLELIRKSILELIEIMIGDAKDAVQFNRQWKDFHPEKKTKDELPQCIFAHQCGRNVTCLLCPVRVFEICLNVMKNHVKDLGRPFVEDPDDEEKLKNKLYADFLSEQVENIQEERMFVSDYISNENVFSERRSEIRKRHDIPSEDISFLALFNLFIIKRMSTNGDGEQ